MVDRKLHLEPVYGDLTPPRDDAGVVDEHMDTGVPGLEIGSSLPDRSLGRQVGGYHVGDEGSLDPDVMGD
jgi:hypothetical protein